MDILIFRHIQNIVVAFSFIWFEIYALFPLMFIAFCFSSGLFFLGEYLTASIDFYSLFPISFFNLSMPSLRTSLLFLLIFLGGSQLLQGEVNLTGFLYMSNSLSVCSQSPVPWWKYRLLFSKQLLGDTKLLKTAFSL